MSSNALVTFNGIAPQIAEQDCGDEWIVDGREAMTPPHVGATFCFADLGGGRSVADAAAAYRRMASLTNKPVRADQVPGEGRKRGIWL